jgi:integrase
MPLGEVPVEQPIRTIKYNLTERFILSRKPAQPGGRDPYYDAIVPGMLLRVTDSGHKSFCLAARYPLNPKNPTTRSLGDVGKITLEKARQKAREWLELIGKGIDPKIEEDRIRAEAKRRQDTTFGKVWDEFDKRHASKLAKATEIRAIFESEFLPRWRNRPIEYIQPAHCSQAIRAIVDRDAPAQAHNAFANLRGLFNWAIGTGEFGLTNSPMANLSPKSLIGARVIRKRVLTDDELRKVWAATEALGYPYRDVVKLLILTGQREDQIARLSWRDEIDLNKREFWWSAERMKTGEPFLLPMAPMAFEVVRSLPRWTRGDFAFTTREGAIPVNGFSKCKARLDRLSGVTGWVLHDLRRTMRSHLSALPVQQIVRELNIAHKQKGLSAVYDQHLYLDEKRECLVLWERRLAGILYPPPADVTDLGEERVRRGAA